MLSWFIFQSICSPHYVIVYEMPLFWPTRVKLCCVLEQGTFTPQKVLVIPRKRWFHPNMTEKLFTGSLRINQPTNHCLDRGCIQYVSFRAGSLKNLLGINISYPVHFLRSRRPLLLHLPTPFEPITPAQFWWSVPTLALKSLRRISLS